MAHEVESMMYVGELPWHGLGVKVDNLATSEEALKAAGLDWEVIKTPVYQSVMTPGDISYEPVPGYKNIVRASDGKVLSIMKDSYQPHAPKECFKFFDAVVGEKLAIYETAGSLCGGKKVWMLAELPGDIRVPGTDDIVKKKLLLATSFDGSIATVTKLTPTRVVCANTLNEALRGEGEYIKVRHSRKLDNQVVEARRVLGIAQKQYDAFEAMVTKLAASPFSENSMRGLAASLFPSKGQDDEGQDIVSTRAEAHRDLLVDLFENGKGQEMVRGTAWAAFNAVTEFTDHYRDTRVTKKGFGERDTRLNSIWFGSSANMKAQSMQYIQEAIG